MRTSQPLFVIQRFIVERTAAPGDLVQVVVDQATDYDVVGGIVDAANA